MMGKLIKTVFGILLFLAGISFFFYPDYKAWRNQESVKELKDRFVEIQKEDREDIFIESNPIQIPENINVGMETISGKVYPELFRDMQRYNERLVTDGQDIADAWSFQQMPFDIRQVQGTGAFGVIEIPEIDLSLPLYIGASNENMAMGAAVLSETSMPIGGRDTNCVIAGHRGWNGSPYFRDIDKLVTGSRICIMTIWGEQDYLVTGSEIIHETDTSILRIQPGKDMVTLLSCYPYMAVGTSYRLAVFCERTALLESEDDKEIKEQELPKILISELLEKDIEEKGIIFEDSPYQKFYENEDLIRRVLPFFMIIIMIVMKAFGFLRRKK